jgi:tetratricopeptide (TPR) repeat protein
MHKKIISAILGINILLPLLPILPILSARAIQLETKENITDRVVVVQTRSGQGSGVIVKRVGNTYTILTAAHVVQDRQNLSVEIITPDRQKYLTNTSEVQIAPDRVDLATITFQSDRNYPVAVLGDSNTIAKGQKIVAAGFLGNLLQFYRGTVVAISRQPQENGYGLVIGTADILPGMSGGGLFTEAGALIGINGKSIGNINLDPNQRDRRDRFKPVSGLAIPINTFTEIASKLRVDINRQPTTINSALTADDFFVAAGHQSQKGDYQSAIANYNRTLSLNPNFGEVYFRRGIARSSVKDWRGAVADYTQAIALNPQHAEAYIHRGNIRNILADWQGAKSDFDLALMFNPSILSAYVGRAIALCELKHCESGLKDYDRAIALNPSSAYIYSSRGFAYYRLGNKQRAISNYLIAADLYQKEGKDRDYLETVEKIRGLVGR